MIISLSGQKGTRTTRTEQGGDSYTDKIESYNSNDQ